MGKLDQKESWALKNWCFRIVVLKKILENLLDCKEIKPVNPKGNQLWILIGRIDAEAKGPILWPPNVKSWLIGKDLDPGKDWRQKEKGVAEDEVSGWHHQINGLECEQTLGDRETWHAVVHGVTKNWTRLSEWTAKHIFNIKLKAFWLFDFSLTVT